MSSPVGIKYVSFAEPSGYGIAGKRCILALAGAGIPVTWTPMVGSRSTVPYYRPFAGSNIGDADLDPFCNREIPYDIVIVHTVPEYFPSWIDRERGKRIIGHTVWETTAIPAHWKPLLNMVDRLWVPCHWNRTVFAEGGVTVPIDVVPHIAAAPSEDIGAVVNRKDGDGYVFYTIGVWTHRKALHCTVTAFCDAFTADDAVTLVIKTSPDDRTASRLMRYLGKSVAGTVRRITSQYPKPPRIRLMTSVVPEQAIDELHHRGDCYVSLCRGEGWGIGAFDAATHGKPVVMTGFGGQLDYLDHKLAYLVNYSLVPVDDPTAPKSYAPDQQWAEPDIGHGARLLRGVMAHPDEANARGRALRADVLARFNARAVIDPLTR